MKYRKKHIFHIDEKNLTCAFKNFIKKCKFYSNLISHNFFI